MQKDKGINHNTDVYTANGGKFKIFAHEKKMGKGCSLGD